MGLFRRTKAADTEAVPPAGNGRGPSGKGRPTPKRQRAAPPPPPPTTRKEAYARLREKSKNQRTKARVGMAGGDDRYVLPRDRGPARRLVRDIVDARRNAGSYIFGFAILIVLVTYAPGAGSALRLAASITWVVIVAGLGLDSYLLSRIIRRLIAERLPEETKMRGHIFYGVMRAATFRRMRNPRPQVKVGATV